MFTLRIKYLQRKIDWSTWTQIVRRHPRIVKKAQLVLVG